MGVWRNDFLNSINLNNFLKYQGLFNAFSGVYPTSPLSGYFWIISVAGVLGGITYNIEDWLVYDGTLWHKVNNLDAQSLPVGGTTGQVLSKNSNTNYDVKWADNDNYLSLDMQSTGILQGGVLSLGSDNTKFNIASGVGLIVDNFTDALNPTKTLVQWSTKSDVVDTLIYTTSTTYINIDLSGSVILTTDPLTDLERRSLIAIGWIDHTGSSPGVNVIYTEPFYNGAIQSQLNDFIENFGAFNIEGNIYQPLSLLTVQRSAGKTFDGNANYENFKRDPHVVTTILEAPVTINYYYQKPLDPSGWEINLPAVINIDPEHWDNETGTLASVAADKFTIQLISF
jgi:hypothetical protein